MSDNNKTLLSWSNLTFRYEPDFVGKMLRNEKPNEIFSGVNGEVNNGKLIGLVGPSGAGKSTLYSVLAGRKIGQVAGEIFREKNTKIALIPQHDELFNLLTVREAFEFSVRLNNPQNTQDAISASSSLIDQLGLAACADQRISTLSGGQKKRVSIAQALVMGSTVLLLDEPSTGLDSVQAFKMMTLLKELLAKKVLAAVFVTMHQPSSKMFNLLDNVYCLAMNGSIIFDGSPKEMASKFTLETLMESASLNDGSTDALARDVEQNRNKKVRENYSFTHIEINIDDCKLIS